VELLIVGPSWLGDAVMMGALIAQLKAADPGGQVTVLAPAHLQDLLGRMPGVDQALVNPFAHGQLRLVDRIRFGHSLKGRYDAAIVLPNSWKSALIPFFAGIPRRTGCVGEARYGLLNDARRLDEGRTPRLVDQYCALGEASAQMDPPRLSVDPDRSRALVRRLGLEGRGPAVALCVGAEYGPAKRWPAAHFAALAERIGSAGRQVWVLGSPGDVSIGAEIEARARAAVVNLTGRTTLGEAIDLLAAAEAVVTNDSGLMHVAAALGRPLVALYGSTSPAFTPPLSADAAILSLGLSCSPCFERQCPLGHLKCLNDLTPDRVWAALQPALGI